MMKKLLLILALIVPLIGCSSELMKVYDNSGDTMLVDLPALTQASNNISSLVGNISNSYVEANGIFMPFVEYDEESDGRPIYSTDGGEYDVVYLPSVQQWRFFNNPPLGGTYSNNSTSFFPPSGWYANTTNSSDRIFVSFYTGVNGDLHEAVEAVDAKIGPPCYGSLYKHYATNLMAIVTTNYNMITNWNTVITNSQATPTNVVLSSTGITVLVAGTFDCHVSLSIGVTGGGYTPTLECALFVNGIEQKNAEFDRKIGTSGDIGSGSFFSQLTLASNDNVSVRIQGDAAGNITIRQAQLVITRVGATGPSGLDQTTADLRYIHPDAEVIAWDKDTGAITAIYTNVQQSVTLQFTNAVVWQLQPITTTNSIILSGRDFDFYGNKNLCRITRQAFNGSYAGFFSIVNATNVIVRDLRVSATAGTGWNATTATNYKPYGLEISGGSNYMIHTSKIQIENQATITTDVVDFCKGFVDVTAKGTKSVQDSDFIIIDTNGASKAITFGATHGGTGIPVVNFVNTRFVSTTNLISMWHTATGALFTACSANYFAGTNVLSNPSYGNNDYLFRAMGSNEARAVVMDGKQDYFNWTSADRSQPQNVPTLGEINNFSIGWKQCPLPTVGIGSASATPASYAGSIAYWTLPTNSNSGFLCPMVEVVPTNGTLTIATTIGFPAGNDGSNAVYQIQHYAVGFGQSSIFPAVPVNVSAITYVTNSSGTNRIITFTNVITGITNHISNFRVQRGVTPTADSGVTNVTLQYFGSRYKVN